MRPNVILKQILGILNTIAQGVKNSVVVDTDNLIQLSGDTSAPGANKTYGTDASGIKGWKSDSTTSIADHSIANVKLADVAPASIKGRITGGGTGQPQDLSAPQVKAILLYAAADISNVPSDNISATDVQAAINELDSEKQPLDSDLTTIAALSASNDDIIQRKVGVWTNRTIAQYKSDLAVSKSDVGLGNVDNTSDLNKPLSTADSAALALKLSLSGGTMTGPIDLGSNKITSLATGSNPGDGVNFGQLSNYASSSGLVTAIKALSPGVWTNISISNGWVAGSRIPQYRIDGFGLVWLRGDLNGSAAIVASFSSSLPASFVQSSYLQTRTTNGAFFFEMQVNTSGVGSFASYASISGGSYTLRLDGTSYWSA